MADSWKILQQYNFVTKDMYFVKQKALTLVVILENTLFIGNTFNWFHTLNSVYLKATYDGQLFQ